MNTATPVSFLTPEQLATRLGIKVQTLAVWRSRGGGPPFTKLGSLVRYEVAAVDAWLQARTFTNAGEAKAPEQSNPTRGRRSLSLTHTRRRRTAAGA